MKKEHRENHPVSSRKWYRNEVFSWAVIAMGAVLFIWIALYYWGNYFVYKTESCTVTDSYFAQSYTSSSQGISFNTSKFIVKSSDCPELRFTREPDGVKSFNEMKSRLVPGQRYTFSGRTFSSL